MKPERLRALLLVAIMAAVALAVAVVTLAVLYESTLETQRRRLIDLVASRESLIDAVYHASRDPQATLDILAEAQREAPSLGETGEFTVARRDGNDIIFLEPLRHSAPGEDSSRVSSVDLAQPMVRALAGEHGTMIGRDYRGETVLAAFSPVDGPDWGLVAKIDLAEVWAPIVRAGGFALLGTFVLVCLGAFVFTRVTSPMLRRMEDSERRFRRIFDAAPASIWDDDWREVVAIVGRLQRAGVEDFQAYFDDHPEVVEEALRAVAIRDVNAATLNMFEAAGKADLVASLETVFATPDTLPVFVGELVALAEGRELYSTEMALRTVTGRLIHTILTMTFPPAGDTSGDVLVALTDITDRELARRDLEAEKLFSEAMLASLPGVAYLFDETLRFRRWNTNFEAVTGYSHEEFAGLSPLDLFRGPDQARVAERIGEVFTTGQSSVEAELVAKDGARIPYFFTGCQVEIEGEQFLIGVGIDVTERRRAQRELAELNVQLEQRITERTRELAHTVEQLEAANKELESFSYTVSHDLRAPLRAIDGFSRILVDEHGERLEGEARRYLQIVRENTRNMGLLIDDLLAFSRLSRQAMHTEPVRFAELVSEAWSDLEPERGGRRIELAVGGLPTVPGDPRLLKQVLLNLLGNAIKFTRTREVAHIEVGVQVLNDDTVVFVRDNGVGFDMRYKDKLFGVFQRLHRADEFEGTGVGLAIVARIVHRHGGRVWAEAEPGNGATFFLSFNGGTHGAEQTD